LVCDDLKPFSAIFQFQAVYIMIHIFLCFILSGVEGSHQDNVSWSYQWNVGKNYQRCLWWGKTAVKIVSCNTFTK